MTAAAFVVTALLASVATMILMGSLVIRPRLHELMRQRDDWRTRALEAEGRIDREEAEAVRLTGSWGSPLAMLEE